MPINILDILKSWGTAFSPSAEQFKKGEARLAICNSCEFKADTPVAHCSVCKCMLKAKIFSNKPCPKEKW
jgi:hypothetical protein